ncbi:flagellar basal body-associated protein FliL [Nocardioides sp. GCM10027113]|uniref:flagellar basal body-associated FliL family protein n=1 Tax=unclassified Nocardioides TaxID=2615069 RepID=UPI0036117C9E
MSTTMLPTDDELESEEGGGKLKKILLVLVVVVVAVAAVWFLFLKPKPVEEPKPGEVVALDPIQINLAGGHYLRMGLALQLVEGAHEVDGSKALDAAIDLFSGEDIGHLADAKHRNELKHELEEELDEAYHHEVLGVYFTEFVTQ